MVEDIAAQLSEEHRHVDELRSGLLAARDRYLVDAAEGAWSSAALLLSEFARHLDTHFSFEEQEGFMLHVTSRRPSLSARVEDLRREHDSLRNDFQDLLAVCARSRSEAARRQLLGPQLDLMLEHLREHERAENALVQEAFLQDPGSGD